MSNHNAPSADETRGMVAVRKDCVVLGKVGALVWSDAGSNASKDASVWTLVPEPGDDAAVPIKDQKVEPFYMSTLGHNPPTRQGYVLKSSALVLQPNLPSAQPEGSSQLEVTAVHTPALASKRTWDEMTANSGDDDHVKP